MISIILGPKGTGKTKTFIEQANKAVEKAHGNVVCIAKGKRLMFDLDRKIRMISTDDFDLANPKVFYGFINGVISQDFDTSDIFIESLNKINPNKDEYEDFIKSLEEISKKFNVRFTITISAEEDEVPEGIKKYMVS